MMFPVELRVALTFFITQGFKSFLNLFNMDVEGKGSAFVAVCVGSVMFFLDGLVAAIPEQYRDFAEAVMGFLVATLGTFGLHRTYKEFTKS